MISLYRPKQLIIVITDTIEKARQFNLLWGVKPVLGNFKYKATDSNNSILSIENLYKQKLLNINDKVIVTAVRYPNPKVNTTMNFFEVHNIEDLVEIFEWD